MAATGSHRLRVFMCTFSHSGQTRALAAACSDGLRAVADQIVEAEIEPLVPRPYPWTPEGFFGCIPECLAEAGEPIRPLADPGDDFDLVVLCCPVWFLSPPPPVISALRDATFVRIAKGRPVILALTARGMWRAAAMRLRRAIVRAGGIPAATMAATFRSGGALSFLSAPASLMTGRPGPFLRGLIPAAGMSPGALGAAHEAGPALARLASKGERPCPEAEQVAMCGTGFSLVTGDPAVPWPETIGRAYFGGAGRFLGLLGKPGSRRRAIAIPLVVAGLALQIILLLPFVAATWKVWFKARQSRNGSLRAEGHS